MHHGFQTVLIEDIFAHHHTAADSLIGTFPVIGRKRHKPPSYSRSPALRSTQHAFRTDHWHSESFIDSSLGRRPLQGQAVQTPVTFWRISAHRGPLHPSAAPSRRIL